MSRASDPVAQIAVICGLAPLAFVLFSLSPVTGVLTTPLCGLSVLGAFGFGLAGVVRAKMHQELGYSLPIAGILLGLIWVTLFTHLYALFSHVG